MESDPGAAPPSSVGHTPTYSSAVTSAGHHTDLQLGGAYTGDLVDGRYHGQGTLVFEKAKYVGGFAHGEFHGEGVMYMEAGKWAGGWERGKMVRGSFVFADGLEHRPVDRCVP